MVLPIAFAFCVATLSLDLNRTPKWQPQTLLTGRGFEPPKEPSRIAIEYNEPIVTLGDTAPSPSTPPNKRARHMTLAMPRRKQTATPKACDGNTH